MSHDHKLIELWCSAYVCFTLLDNKTIFQHFDRHSIELGKVANRGRRIGWQKLIWKWYSTLQSFGGSLVIHKLTEITKEKYFFFLKNSNIMQYLGVIYNYIFLTMKISHFSTRTTSKRKRNLLVSITAQAGKKCLM